MGQGASGLAAGPSGDFERRHPASRSDMKRRPSLRKKPSRIDSSRRQAEYASGHGSPSPSHHSTGSLSRRLVPPLPSLPNELQMGLCIRTSPLPPPLAEKAGREGKRIGRAVLVSDSHGSADPVHEQYKRAALSRVPLTRRGSSGSLPPPPIEHTQPYYHANQSVPALPIRRPSSPLTSRWSPDSLKAQSPLPARSSVRDSFAAPLRNASNRLSRQSIAAYHSPAVSSHSGSRFSVRGLGSLNRSRKKKRAPLRKRTITIVGSQRVASERYTIMKETAARASALRRASSDAASSRRPSFAGERRMSEGDRRSSKSSTRRRSSTATAERRPSAAGERRSSAASSKAPSRRESAARSSISRPSKADAARLHLALPDPPCTPPMLPSIAAQSPVKVADPDLSPSAEALMSYIAASPELTCPEPTVSATKPEKKVAGATPSIKRLPNGHPANHHARFHGSLDASGAVAPEVVEASSSRRPSAYDIYNDEIIEAYQALEMVLAPERRGSAASSTAFPCRRPSLPASMRGAAEIVDRHRKASVDSMASEQGRTPLLPERNGDASRKASISGTSRRMSFPRTVSYAASTMTNESTALENNKVTSPKAYLNVRDDARPMSVASNVSQLPPLLLSAFPAPPTSRLRAVRDRPSVDVTVAARFNTSPSSSPRSIPPSHTSTISTASFSTLATDHGISPFSVAMLEKKGWMSTTETPDTVEVSIEGDSLFEPCDGTRVRISQAPSTPATFTLDDLLDPTSWCVAPGNTATPKPTARASPPAVTTSPKLAQKPLPASKKKADGKSSRGPRMDFGGFSMSNVSPPIQRAESPRPPSDCSPTSRPLSNGAFPSPPNEQDQVDQVPVIYTPVDEAVLFVPPPLPTTETMNFGTVIQRFDFSAPESPYPVFGRGTVAGTPSVLFSPATPKKTPTQFSAAILTPFPSHRRETYPLSESSPKLPGSPHRWQRADTFDDGKAQLATERQLPKLPKKRRVKMEEVFEERRPSIGPDVSVRLGSPSKRGFDKVEIRSWLLQARRDSLAT